MRMDLGFGKLLLRKQGQEFVGRFWLQLQL